jgi:hypothetical protein
VIARDLPARARTVALAAALLLSVPALAACEEPQTNKVYTPGQGVNSRNGQVDVLGALVVSDGKDGGRLIAALTNENRTEADELTGVTPAEGDATIKVGSGKTEIPAGGSLQLADDDAAKVLVKGVTIGGFVRVTFEFRNADSATVDVPVVQPGGDFSGVQVPGQVTPSQTAAQEPTPSESGQ